MATAWRLLLDSAATNDDGAVVLLVSSIGSCPSNNTIGTTVNDGEFNETLVFTKAPADETYKAVKAMVIAASLSRTVNNFQYT